jgi:hypothetical protein
MPLTTKVDTAQKLVTSTAWGPVAAEDFVQARKELVANPKFDASYDRLWDFSGVTEVDIPDGTIAELVATSPSRERAYRAVVCTAPATVQRVQEFIARSRDFNRQIAVFPTLNQAQSWIQSQHTSQPE